MSKQHPVPGWTYPIVERAELVDHGASLNVMFRMADGSLFAARFPAQALTDNARQLATVVMTGGRREAA